jgi:tetratricopeptide (TPR) repeat protein
VPSAFANSTRHCIGLQAFREFDIMTSLQDTLELAFRCHQVNDLSQAEQLYRQILLADPNHADAHHLLGVVGYQTGRLDMAMASIGRALALNPWAAMYHSNLGLAQKSAGLLEEATASFEQAIRLQPTFAEALSNLGEVLEQRGRFDEAEHHCRHALQCRPQFPQALNALGNVLLDRRQFDEAIACYHQALALKPDFAKAHNNLGNAYLGLGRLDDAIACYNKALRLDQRFAQASYNLANALRQQGKVEDAINAYRQAIDLNPGYLGTHNNLANLLKEQGRFEEALACYDRALICDPTYGETHLNRGMLLLLLGKWDEGWAEYEWRWHTKEFAWYAPQRPRWDGSDLGGRTVLVNAEQGNGDTLMFARFAPLIKSRGGRVLVRCQPALVALLETCNGIDCVLPNGAALPAFDYEVPLLSLPGLFRTTPASVPADVPYLFATAKATEHWRQVLAQFNDGAQPRCKIGIAWQGRATYLYDRERSLPLAHFGRLAQVAGVQLISLQKGSGTEQLAALANKFSVIDLESRLGDDNDSFMNIAAIIKNLDLVICCDTAIAHLAGALGVPVWVVLPYVPDWRWLLRRQDTPWYRTMRLFRQTHLGDWQGVFERMAHELDKHFRPNEEVSGGSELRGDG